MPEIAIKNISKRFGKNIWALQDLSLNVADGEILGLLGPSGAGKTTLLRVICGLLKPDTGKIFIDGKDITRLQPEKRGIAYLPQTYSLFPQLSVWENTVFSPKVRQRPRMEWEELGNEILTMVGLRLRRFSFPSELSGGMQQRLALSRALATDFDILLLDEPLRALDARLRIELREELYQLSRNLNKTVIWVTHDQVEAMSVADRLAVLQAGKLHQVGYSENLYNNPLTPFVASFLGEANYFEGQVRESASNSSKNIIITKDGLNIEFIKNNVKGQVSAYIKTENCHPLVSGKKGNSSSFKVQTHFKSYHFTGKWAVINCQATEKTEIKCKIESKKVKEWNLRPNTPISIEVDPHKVHVFPLIKGVS